MAPYRLTAREGPRVKHQGFEQLDAALDALEARAEWMEGAERRDPVDLRFRRFEAVHQVAARVEIAGPRRLRGGIDVRGDGSVEAYTGRWRRRLVEQREGESAPAALRRALARG